MSPPQFIKLSFYNSLISVARIRVRAASSSTDNPAAVRALLSAEPNDIFNNLHDRGRARLRALPGLNQPRAVNIR